MCRQHNAPRSVSRLDAIFRDRRVRTPVTAKGMKRQRHIPVRIVPLRSVEAADAYVDGTIDDRLALVALLSRRAWMATERPFPSYDRASIPVVMSRLADQR